MTGEQFAIQRVKPNIDAGDIFVDQNVAKRTALLIKLATTPDEDLDNFDFISIWDEAADYTPPPVETISTSTWDNLMASIPWNIKLF
jgi:hypothetical protein